MNLDEQALVRCSESILQELLSDLDSLTWSDPGGAAIRYEHQPIGSTVVGGMGGGVVTERIWAHDELAAHASTVRDIIEGRRTRPLIWESVPLYRTVIETGERLADVRAFSA